MKNIFSKKKQTNESKNSASSVFLGQNKAKWTERRFEKFADEAFIKNVIAHRSITMIAQAASSVKLKTTVTSGGKILSENEHPLYKLLNRPNPCTSQKEFMESIYAYRQIAGNAYVQGVVAGSEELMELYVLRPDRVHVVENENFIPKGYIYKTQKGERFYPVNSISGRSDILHLKNFNPLSDWYGLSSIEAAAYSIDQHNQAGKWNQALLQNGARPSGAFIVKGENSSEYGTLSNHQATTLREMLDNMFSGPANAGRPMILEGGLEWQEMSMTPKDMDFISSKHSSARDIALALGMPPQLLGIPGDNTYSNMQEARLAFWEQTVIPLVDNVVNNLSSWLNNYYVEDISLDYDLDNIPALSDRREALWNRLEKCTFMTDEEKREMLGLKKLENSSHNVNFKT